MENFLERLYYIYGKPYIKFPVEEQRIKARMANLKKTLKPSQYKQVFRIIDDTDCIADKMSVINFKRGMKFGILCMIEVFKDYNDE